MTAYARRRISSARRIVGLSTALILMTALLEIAVGNVRAFQVVSRSMEPTLQIGDCVLSIYELSDADLSGRVVAFDPKEPGDALVKRVVGQPGDEVEIRDGKLFVGGEQDRFSPQEIARIDGAHWKVDRDRLFVVGDNRNNSYDSIDHGPIDRSQVLGVVAFRYWPLTRIGLVE